MTAHSPTSPDVITPLSPEEQAAALWTFVHLKTPRFPYDAALEVVKRLAPRPDEAPKTLAKRVRKELSAKGVHVKHEAALQAAARLLGFESWYAAKESSARLKLITVGPSGGEKLVETWHELAPKLCAACDEFLAERSARIFQVRFGPAYMMLSAQVVADDKPEQPQSWPLLVVNPLREDPAWLDDAPPALEYLRRYLEQGARAVLDGFAVMQLCNMDKNRPGAVWPHSPRPSDACNAELILVRADHELDPGFEVARGDEMTCWYQFELAIKDHKTEAVMVDEEYGAWHVGAGRYVWQLSVLRPKEIIPGLMIHELGFDESERLFKRYMLAKRLLGSPLARQDQTKRLDYLGSVPETYRIDLRKLLLAMNKAGLDWESYCAEIGDTVPLEPHLPVGFVLALLERMNLADPNAVFARPTRSELFRVDDDKLLRTLLPRVDHVRYRLRRGVSAEIQAAVREAIEELSSSMFVQQAQAVGQLMDPKDPLPYLVFAGDAEELRLKLAEHGLLMHAGVMPFLRSTKGIIEQREGMWPYAVGHSLYLDIDFDDAPKDEKEKGAG